jgi:ketosteroid isomerase-like protein
MNKALDQLLDSDRAFAKMSEEKGAEAAFAYYLTPDALQLAQGQLPIIGAKNISQVMKPGDPEEVLVWEPQGGKASQSEDLGYTWGMYTVKIGQKKLFEGKYLNIWVKQPGGSWKVEVDMGNTNPKQ